jgi:hypothetical protein
MKVFWWREERVATLDVRSEKKKVDQKGKFGQNGKKFFWNSNDHLKLKS